MALMAKAPPPLSLRLGEEGTRALEDLARLRRVSKAEAARQAIDEAAKRERKQRSFAADARRLSEDLAYVEEAREIVAFMEELRGPW
jgi:hypothetical protein